METCFSRAESKPVLSGFRCIVITCLALVIPAAYKGELNARAGSRIASGEVLAPPAHSDTGRYFRYSYWSADARTLVAAVQFILESN